MIKNKKQIKEILEMNIADEEKIDRIAETKSTKTDIGRIILTDELLDWEEGQVVTNIGRHWADRNDENIAEMGYQPDSGMGEIEYLIFAYDVEGYKIPYLNEMYFEELGYDEDEAYEKAEEMEEDEVYSKLTELIGTDANMQDECEILISNNKTFEIVRLCDERDETGYITVELKEV